MVRSGDGPAPWMAALAPPTETTAFAERGSRVTDNADVYRHERERSRQWGRSFFPLRYLCQAGKSYVRTGTYSVVFTVDRDPRRLPELASDDAYVFKTGEIVDVEEFRNDPEVCM